MLQWVYPSCKENIDHSSPIGRENCPLTRPVRTEWKDGTRMTLEDCLNDIVAYFYLVAEALREKRLERARCGKKWAEESVHREKERQRQMEDKRRAEELKRQVEKWQWSQEIRAYIAALRQAAELPGRSEGSGAVEEWVAWAMKLPLKGLQELLELLDRQSRLPDYGPQRPRGDLAMIGNSDASMGMIDLSHDDVAGPLPVLLVPHLRQRRYHLAARHPRQLTHTATSITSSSIEGGMGSP